MELIQLLQKIMSKNGQQINTEDIDQIIKAVESFKKEIKKEILDELKPHFDSIQQITIDILKKDFK